MPGRVRFSPSRGRPDEVSLARRESRADFPEVSLQLVDPSERKLALYGGFCREENVIVFLRSTFYLVCCSIYEKQLSAGAPIDLF